MPSRRNLSGMPLASDQWLEAHHRAKLPERARFAARLARLKPTCIVDVGCGTGLWLDLLNGLVSIDCEFIGIDVDEDSLSRAATRARGWSRSSRFMQLDVNRQPEQVPSGDLCLLFNVSSYIDDFGGLLRTLRIHRPGGAVAIRQYDGAALRFGPMPPESRLSIDSALHSAVRPLSHFRHYDMDRVVEEIQAAGFASTTVEFELYARVAPFSAEDFAYIDAMIGWTREHVSGIATPLLDSWWRAALKDGAAAYVYEVDLVALLS